MREFGADHVLLATGARWRRDGLGRSRPVPIEFPGDALVLTPDDLMDGRVPAGEVLLFDDDNYYLGPVLALLLARSAARVCYVTSGSRAGEWSKYTGEQDRTQRQMLEAGIEIRCNETLAAFDGRTAALHCVYTGNAAVQPASAVVLVTSREPDDALYYELVGSGGAEPGTRILRIGDCLQPSIIAAAVYSGHKAARELGSSAPAVALRDRVQIAT